jgi:hypothetical protein
MKQHLLTLAVVGLLAVGCSLPVARAANMRGSSHQREFTFVDHSGGYVGNTKCVSGVLYAQLIARNKNTPVTALPGFIQEYCEEDIALALGVPESDFKGSAGKVWREAFHAGVNPASTVVKTDGAGNNHTAHIFVSAANQVVEVPAELSLKLDMSSKLCTKLSSFYKPGRFANRADALVYCTAVKKALAGNVKEAEKGIPAPLKPLTVLRKSAQTGSAGSTTNCPPGATNIECGIDTDGSRIDVEAFRSSPEFSAVARKINMNNQAVARSVEADNQYNAVFARLGQLVSLRDKKVSRTVVVANLTLRATGMTGQVTRERVGRILGVTLYGAFHTDPRDVKVKALRKAGAGPGAYEALLTIAIAPNADSATTIAMIENGKDFAARVNDQIKRLTNGIFVVAKASGAREATFHDVPQPAWFVKSVNAKIKSMQPELKAAKNEKVLTDKLVSMTLHAMKAHVAAARAESSADPETVLLRKKADRLEVEQHLADARVKISHIETKMARLDGREKKSPKDLELLASLRVQREAAQKALERAVEEERKRKDLGEISNLAAELERTIESSASPVERARAEARLAELVEQRESMEREAKHAKLVKLRLARMREAVRKEPHNKILRKRLERMLAEEGREKKEMAAIIKGGDRCAPCRTRVMGVMEGALNSGVLTKDLPSYMRSFCEVRLASTGGEPDKLRSRDSISRVCLKFETHLKRNLDESEAVQAKAVMAESHDMSHDGKRTNLNSGAMMPVRRKVEDDDVDHKAAVHNYCIATSECAPADQVHKSPGPRTTCERCAAEILGAVDNWKRAGEAGTAQQMSSKVNQYCVSRLSRTWSFGKDLIRDTCARAMDKDGAPIFAPSVVKSDDRDAEVHNHLSHAFSFCKTVGECPKDKPLPDVDAKMLVKEQHQREQIVKDNKKTIAAAGTNIQKCRTAETIARESLQAEEDVANKCRDGLKKLKFDSKDLGFEMESACQLSRASASQLENAQSDVESNRGDAETLRKKVVEKQEECKITQEDRARKTQTELEKAKGDLIAETGRINQEIAELNAEIASKGESGLQSTKKAQLEVAHEHATAKYQEVQSSLAKETKEVTTKCEVHVKTLQGAIETAEEALAASFKVLDSIKNKTDGADKACKRIVTRKGAVEEEVTKRGQKCTRLDEQVAKSRKSVAIARAKCDAHELTKEMQEKEVTQLEDDPVISATGISTTGIRTATGPSMFATAATGVADDSFRPNSHFPRTIGDCSLKVLGHLDKERERTSKEGFWSVIGKWARSTCLQMATASKAKNGAIACAHAEALFSSGSAETDVRRSERYCKTVLQFVFSKPQGPLYMRQPLLPVAPTLRPSSNELLYTFSPGAQIDGRRKHRTLENPATDEEKVRQRFGKEPGHFYGILASEVAMQLARKKTKTPEEKLISKMESSFGEQWRAKQESLGVRLGVAYDEDGNELLAATAGTGATGETGATGANSATAASGATGATGATGEENLSPQEEEDREKKEEAERVARLYRERLSKELDWAKKSHLDADQVNLQ